MTTPADNRQTPEQASHDESRREAFDRYMRTTGWGGIPADAFRDAVLACLHPPTIPPNHRVEAANDAYTLASPVENPAQRGEWWAVYVTDSKAPDEPIALFEYPDQAGQWAKDNYPHNHRVEKINTPLATGLNVASDADRLREMATLALRCNPSPVA